MGRGRACSFLDEHAGRQIHNFYRLLMLIVFALLFGCCKIKLLCVEYKIYEKLGGPKFLNGV